MASSLLMKHPRNSLNASKKKQICLYKQAHLKATYDGIQADFEKDWGFKVGLSTIGDVWRMVEGRRQQQGMPYPNANEPERGRCTMV